MCVCVCVCVCVCDCDLIQRKAKSVLHGKASWVSLFFPRQHSASLVLYQCNKLDTLMYLVDSR